MAFEGGFGGTLDHFGVTLGALAAYGVTLGSLWGYFGVSLGSVWVSTGDFVSLDDYVAMVVESPWVYEGLVSKKAGFSR